MKTVALVVLGVALVACSCSAAYGQQKNDDKKFTRPQTNQDSNKPEEKIYDAKEVDRKAIVLSKPEPSYTDEARRQHVVGVVELRAIFAANGQIKGIEVRKALPAGLTENAIAVARKITFTPAIKDGNPVSQRMTIEYSFTLLEKIIHGQRFPKVYYHEGCRDYSNIASNNMVFFTSEKEAKKAGYKKSKTCP